MKRLVSAALFTLIAAQPTILRAFQSPVASPTAPASPVSTSIPLTAPAPISPLIWIAVGFLVGAAIVLAMQRASPHD